jgi:hypothetical protein
VIVHPVVIIIGRLRAGEAVQRAAETGCRAISSPLTPSSEAVHMKATAHLPSARPMRRLLACGAIAAALTLPALSAGAEDRWSPANGEVLALDIYDGTKPAGSLQITFERPDPSTLLIKRHQQMTIKRMLISAKLEQRSQQRIVDGRFTSFNSTTSLKSTIKDMDATLEVSRAADGTLAGKSTGKPLGLPADSQPLAMWSIDALRDGPYFDPGEGKPAKLTVKRSQPVAALPPSYKGRPCTSSSELTVVTPEKTSGGTVWYDGRGKICAMRFQSELGALDYVEKP